MTRCALVAASVVLVAGCLPEPEPPQKVKCFNCKGTGKTLCVGCQGNGDVAKFGPGLKVTGRNTCGSCRGTGGHRCFMCNGTGKR
jgi:hypothetical protein